MRALLVPLLLAGLATTGQATAASLAVAPTRVELAAEAPSGAVTLRNEGAGPVTVQVQAFAWPRTPAIDDLEPTRELIAVPAVFALDPGAQQVIRVALRGQAEGPSERAFRLLITEVPVQPAEGKAGVRFALRLSLPVFVRVPGARPLPSWSARREPGGVVLELENRGSAHLRVSQVTLRRPGETTPVQVIEGLTYVLPGRSHRWSLPAAALPAGGLELEAETDAGRLEAKLALAPG